MRVLEIGCGAVPGPRFADATSYIAVDADPEMVAMATQVCPEMEVEVGDATQLAYADNSFDVVLARNVLGDPYLGVRRTLLSAYIQVLSSSSREDIELVNAMNSSVANRKLATVKEAMRILVPAGIFLVVEDLTPFVANRFFDAHSDILVEDRIALSPAHDIANSALPADYISVMKKIYAHEENRGVVWALQSSVRTQK